MKRPHPQSVFLGFHLECPDAVSIFSVFLSNLPNNHLVTVTVADRYCNRIPDPVMQKSLSKRRLNADEVFHGISPDAGDDLVSLAFVIFLDVDGDAFVESDFIRRRTVLHDDGIFQHPLQIADPAVVGSVFPSCGVILKILA